MPLLLQQVKSADPDGDDASEWSVSASAHAGLDPGGQALYVLLVLFLQFRLMVAALMLSCYVHFGYQHDSSYCYYYIMEVILDSFVLAQFRTSLKSAILAGSNLRAQQCWGCIVVPALGISLSLSREASDVRYVGSSLMTVVYKQANV